MSDGMSDCARAAENRARAYVKEHYSNLKEFNPYHVPYRGRGYVIYETWLDHALEIIKNHKVIKRYQFDTSGMIANPKWSDVEGRDSLSIAAGSGVEV